MPVVIKLRGGQFFRFLWVLEMFDLVGPGALVGSLVLPRPLRTGLFGSAGEIRTDLFLNGILGSGGFRRVRSGVRIRKLLTRASGTLLASRLGRDKIWKFLGGDMSTW